MMKKYFCNDKGGLLVLTLMVFLIFSVLGIALLTLSFSDVTLSEVDHDTQSAYYIAEAGANEAYVTIKNEIESTHENTTSEATYFPKVDQYLQNNWTDKTLSNFRESFGEQPKANITIHKIGDSPTTYEIKSDGYIEERKRTVTKQFTVNWNKGPNIHFPDNVAGIFKDKMELNSTPIINGDVLLTSNLPNSIYINEDGKINGTAFVPEEAVEYVYDGPSDLKMPIEPITHHIDWEQYENLLNQFPNTYPNYSIPEDQLIATEHNSHLVINDGKLDISHHLVENYTLELEDNIAFKKIYLTSDYTLHLDTKGETINIVVDDLDISQGHIHVKGNGVVNMYVRNEIILGGDSTFNKDGRTEQLNLYYKGPHEINVDGAQILNTSLFSKQANIHLTAGGNFQGFIISGGDRIILNGGHYTNSMILAPMAEMDLIGGAKVDGVVLAKEFFSKGGTSLNYRDIDINQFPIDFQTEDSDGDIIDSEPIIETDD